MTGDLVNLRQFKKRRARQEKERAAENNRIAFGRSKTEKAQSRKVIQQQEKAHEAGRLEEADRGTGKNPLK